MVRTELQDVSLGRCNSKGTNSSSSVSSMSLKAKTQPKSVSFFLVLNNILKLFFFCLVLVYILKIGETYVSTVECEIQGKFYKVLLLPIIVNYSQNCIVCSVLRAELKKH